ncbi:hypothetical protein ACT691_01730 [Vibrio metschnikovii]
MIALEQQRNFNHCEVTIEQASENQYLMLQAIARYKDEIFIGFSWYGIKYFLTQKHSTSIA